VLQQTLDSARVTFQNAQKITSDLDELMVTQPSVKISSTDQWVEWLGVFNTATTAASWGSWDARLSELPWISQAWTPVLGSSNKLPEHSNFWQHYVFSRKVQPITFPDGTSRWWSPAPKNPFPPSLISVRDLTPILCLAFCYFCKLAH